MGFLVGSAQASIGFMLKGMFVAGFDLVAKISEGFKNALSPRASSAERRELPRVIYKDGRVGEYNLSEARAFLSSLALAPFLPSLALTPFLPSLALTPSCHPLQARAFFMLSQCSGLARARTNNLFNQATEADEEFYRRHHRIDVAPKSYASPRGHADASHA